MCSLAFRACLLAVCLLTADCSAVGRHLLAQSSPELPRLEYYVARDLYDAGNISEATEGFRVAINRGQQVKNQRWIDSIPPLVMLGECYYQQGAIGQGLEQFDAALMVALTFPNWGDALRAPTNLPEVSSDVRAINWLKPARATNVVRVPNVMQVAVDPASARIGADGNLAAGGAAIMR
ncbi:MAG: hypothetical protein IT423_11300, partial [Pirellulaceae bacterium]|nr:hypothetical protein [Pirellulaceae bacterium]